MQYSDNLFLKKKLHTYVSPTRFAHFPTDSPTWDTLEIIQDPSLLYYSVRLRAVLPNQPPIGASGLSAVLLAFDPISRILCRFCRDTTDF